MKSTTKGFTFMELLILVMLLGLVAAVLIPALAKARSHRNSDGLFQGASAISRENIEQNTVRGSFKGKVVGLNEVETSGNLYFVWRLSLGTGQQLHTCTTSIQQTNQNDMLKRSLHQDIQVLVNFTNERGRKNVTSVESVGF